MFIHREQLEYILSPDQYRSQEQYDVELERLFLPGWHLVGLTSEVPRDGDFKTLDLLGKPLLLKRMEGELRVFLNVCSHRHCRLTDELHGSSAEIRCQYHGWEYGPQGQVTRVPDGGCFKPFDRENSRLQKFAVATCGDLIFVQLNDGGPSLEQYLGHFYRTIAERFQRPWAHNWHYVAEFPCNWKIPVENTVETYHVPSVHPKSLVDFGLLPEDAQEHVLESTHTTLVYSLDPGSKSARLQRSAIRWLGGAESTNKYTHHHIHPNLVFTFSDIFMHAQVYLPTGPACSRTEAWMFCLDGVKRNPISRTVAYFARRHGRSLNSAIQREDATVFSSQQQGIAVSPHPGCIGTREERIYAFHCYLKDAVGRGDAGADER